MDELLSAKDAMRILGVKWSFDMAELGARLAHYTMPEPNSGCHMFTGVIGTFGYGYIKVSGSPRFAHRVSFVLAGRVIPEGLVIDHLCRNRACVNPDHLEAVTNRENLLRGIGPSARHARATACPSGHPYDTANTYRSTNGDRHCRSCHREQERHRRAAIRSEREPHRMKTLGSGNGRSKLSEADVLAIRSRRAAGERAKDLASEFGVSDTVICGIAKRRSWRHLP